MRARVYKTFLITNKTIIMPIDQFTKQVKEFHKTFGHPVLDKPTQTNRGLLRVNLLKEEVSELEAAIAEDNLLEVLDALVDIQYVLSGAVLEFGFANVFEAAFREVHRSNMTKAFKTKYVAVAFCNKLNKNDKDNSYGWKQIGDYYTVYRGDGKIMKNPEYSKADLKPYLTD
jgi:predicted HAD superfamily Cof-like phosphohydrolase